MYELRRWKRVFVRALERAYEMEGKAAFIQFHRRQSKRQDTCLIKNMDAYEVAEKMQRGLLEVALSAEKELSELV